MKLALIHIALANRANRKDPVSLLIQDYTGRIARMIPCETLAYPSEAALLESIDRQTGRVPTHLCLFDSTGIRLSSVEFAQSLGTLRDAGTQRIIFGVGPASGWSRGTLARADRVVSLGSFTLPHELARVVVAEQIYRALTILAGHPYHLGH